MKVEVRCSDYPDQENYWVATVIRICGYKLLLRYAGCGENPEKDFWISISSKDVHPIGWGFENNKITLTAPECEYAFPGFSLSFALRASRKIFNIYIIQQAWSLNNKFIVHCFPHFFICRKSNFQLYIFNEQILIFQTSSCVSVHVLILH